MAVRNLDGFMLVSTAVQVEPGSKFYRPGVLVRRENEFEGTTYVFDGDGLTEDDAHIRANGYIATVVAVTKDGLLWDRPKG